MSNMWRALECNLFIEINGSQLISLISSEIQQEDSLIFNNPILNKSLKLNITEDTLLTKSNSGIIIKIFLTKNDFLKLSSCDLFGYHNKVFPIKLTNLRKNTEDYISVLKTSKIIDV